MLSLDQLRRSAKALAKSHALGDPSAIQRVRMAAPRADGARLKHADYLQVIARETGFDSWPRLKFAADTQGLDRAARVQRLRQALYHGQGWMARALLAKTPDLAAGCFDLACALYDVDAVRAALAEDPALALAPVARRRPILHLAYSHWIHERPDLGAAMLQVADLLLAHGADVNDGFAAAPGSDHLLSALYGAIGHANNIALGRWLLDHGADPNDGESLYHATELGHHDGLRLLLDHGADPTGTNALLRALDFDDAGAVRLLLAHGAQVDAFDDREIGGERPAVIPALHQAARRGCGAEVVTLLLDHGADPGGVYQGASAYGFARVFGHTALADAIAARGGAVALAPQEAALVAAAEGRASPAQLRASDLPPAYGHLIRQILPLGGRLDHVRRLVDLGLPFDAPDDDGLTPVQVAGWEGLADEMRYFLSLGPDLTHVNQYGGGLISTILHGADHCPTQARRDHLTCARLALEAGAPLLDADRNGPVRADMELLFEGWAPA
ncbi:MAG: ankyrin repeat domain-containing protein [Marinibacterium sp.]|nr:ankyrin repeat domain-containing protein [Marinibacterium sp.]